MIAKLRDHPLVAVVGPSGVGKSSFVRAGVVPALKASGEPWEVIIVRPGRYPLSAVVSTLQSLRDPGTPTDFANYGPGRAAMPRRRTARRA